MSGQESNTPAIGATIPGFVLAMGITSLEWIEAADQVVGLGILDGRVVAVDEQSIRWTHDHNAADGPAHSVEQCWGDMVTRARESAAIYVEHGAIVAGLVQQGMPLDIAVMAAAQFSDGVV